MRPHSDFVRIRGLRYHVRRWGDPQLPPLWLLHGWLDVSATWHPVAVPLTQRFHVLAPDWRGFGASEWPQDGYWFQDYVADFEALADHCSSQAPLTVVGHSMGGQIASLYAGLRPARVSQLVLLDSLFLPDMEDALVLKRFRRWLDQLKDPPRDKTYDSFDELAARIRKQHPALDPGRARFIAECWGRADGHGRIGLCADPKHRLDGPGLFHVAESMAIWREVTARTLFLDGANSPFLKAIGAEELARRRACFRDRTEGRVENAAHMLHFDAPEATARAILDFLAAPAVPKERSA
ncbi:MAG TPA: alpha/beta hydrolase [Candidatus Binatia bacterium]|nr:alpha/beta hydrolase [Candidatus Binatia bacterium]